MKETTEYFCLANTLSWVCVRWQSSRSQGNTYGDIEMFEKIICCCHILNLAGYPGREGNTDSTGKYLLLLTS